MGGYHKTPTCWPRPIQAWTKQIVTNEPFKHISSVAVQGTHHRYREAVHIWEAGTGLDKNQEERMCETMRNQAVSDHQTLKFALHIFSMHVKGQQQLRGVALGCPQPGSKESQASH